MGVCNSLWGLEAKETEQQKKEVCAVKKIFFNPRCVLLSLAWQYEKIIWTNTRILERSLEVTEI
jgi:hypothetical protein